MCVVIPIVAQGHLSALSDAHLAALAAAGSSSRLSELRLVRVHSPVSGRAPAVPTLVNCVSQGGHVHRRRSCTAPLGVYAAHVARADWGTRRYPSSSVRCCARLFPPSFCIVSTVSDRLLVYREPRPAFALVVVLRWPDGRSTRRGARWLASSSRSPVSVPVRIPDVPGAARCSRLGDARGARFFPAGRWEDAQDGLVGLQEFQRRLASWPASAVSCLSQSCANGFVLDGARAIRSMCLSVSSIRTTTSWLSWHVHLTSAGSTLTIAVPSARMWRTLSPVPRRAESRASASEVSIFVAPPLSLQDATPSAFGLGCFAPDIPR